MADDERVLLGLVELSRKIHDREISPVEITLAVLDRIERLDPALHAFATVTAESALAKARDAESEIAAGHWRGPLHGVPVSIKDLFDLRGVATTAASRFLEDSVAVDDSALVERFDAAGAVIVGKNNLHEFAYGTTSTSSIFGAVRNPWNLARMAGGSSGGSAAAVAAGLSFASIGTDTGGSVRIPASACGVTGLKPTFGRVSRAGLIPLAPSLDHVGPFARNAADVAAVLQVIARADSRDSATSPTPVPDFSASFGNQDLSGVRIGVLETTIDQATPDSAKAMREACDAFCGLGAEVVSTEIVTLEALRHAAYVVLFSESAATHWERMQEAPQRFFPDVRERFERAQTMTGVDYVRALEMRERGRREVDALFERIDLVLSPLVPMAAPTLETSEVTLGGEAVSIAAATTANTREWNLLGNPALCVPCGFSEDGLPLGMQLAGRHFEEATLLRAGVAYQRITDWHQRHPPL